MTTTKNIFIMLALIVGGLLSMNKINAQNQYQITQYMVYQPYINPAALATYEDLSGAAVYRTQWTGITGAPTTAGIAVNSPIKQSNLYLGGLLIQDNIGANKNSKVDLQVAYRLKLNEKQFISLALKGGGGFYQTNYDDIYLNDAGDNEFVSGSQNEVLPNFGFGTMWYSNKHYVGLSIPAFLKNTSNLVQSTSFNPQSFHFYLNGGYSFELNPNLDLNTSVFGKFVSGSPLHGDLNAQLMFKKTIGLGINYRSSQEVSGILTWNINKYIGLSYAYDFTFSNLSALSGGSHEIMLIFSRQEKALLQLSSPRF